MIFFYAVLILFSIFLKKNKTPKSTGVNLSIRSSYECTNICTLFEFNLNKPANIM